LRGGDVATLGDVIRLRKGLIMIEDSAIYKRCRVQVYGKGVVLRDEVIGAEIKTKKQQVCRAGDFIVAEIDAKVGGFGVVPSELDGAIVSTHYFLFDVDKARVMPEYLSVVVTSPTFQDQVRAKGSTNYAAIRPADVLGYSIPLPSLGEQKRAVDLVRAVHRGLDQALQAQRRNVGYVDAVETTWFDSLTGEFPSAPLGGVAKVIDPNPSHRYPAYTDDGVPMVSSVDFTGADEIDDSRARKVPAEFFQATLGRHGVSAGDVIFARKGKIGYARPYPEHRDLAMTHTLCVLKPDQAILDGGYLLAYARSRGFLGYLSRTMNPNLGVPTLGLDVIRGAPLPLPSLTVQRGIVEMARQVADHVRLLRMSHLEFESQVQGIASATVKAALQP